MFKGMHCFPLGHSFNPGMQTSYCSPWRALAEIGPWFCFPIPKPLGYWRVLAEIGPWFWFPIPKWGFGRTIIGSIVSSTIHFLNRNIGKKIIVTGNYSMDFQFFLYKLPNFSRVERYALLSCWTWLQSRQASRFTKLWSMFIISESDK